MPGTERAYAPAFSPDGLSVALSDAGGIRTVSLAGGLPATIASAGGATYGLAWGSDGMIYFARENLIYRVPATGGEPEAVTVPTEGGPQAYPDALPDGLGALAHRLHRPDHPEPDRGRGP